MNTPQMLGLILAWCFIAAGSWLVWQLVKQNGRILLRLDELEKRLDELTFGEENRTAGLPLDSTAPEFSLPDLNGNHRRLAEYRGQRLLLIFFNPECGFCRDMMPKLTAVDLAATPPILIITSGEADKNRRFFTENKLPFPILLQKEMEVAAVYQANGTPTGYLIDEQGKIASQLAVGAETILALCDGRSESVKQTAEIDARASRFSNRSLARSKIKRDGLKAGTDAPNFRLPRVDGRGELLLEEFRGKRVLLVFSDPHCGPCNLLAPELEQFHRENPGVSVLLISRGEPKENRAKVKEHQLTFPVVLQQQREISRLYAMFATPIAYLVDEAGIIMRDVAVGLVAIQNLMAEAKRE